MPKPDVAVAAVWLQQAHEAGSVKGSCDYAYMMASGLGVRKCARCCRFQSERVIKSLQEE